MKQNSVLIIHLKLMIFKYFLLPSITTINAISGPIIVEKVILIMYAHSKEM